MEEDNKKQELISLYENLISEQVSFLKETYYKMFSNLDSQSLKELYMTYYAKTKMSPSFVYFIHNKYTNLIKIGKSNNPFKRLNELNSMFKNHFGVENALSMLRIVFVPSGKDYIVESMYHKKYENFRTFGEWFNISENEICELLPEFLNYDTDNFLENEGFEKDIIFNDVDSYTYEIFSLDTLDEYTFKIAENDKRKALYLKKIIDDAIKEKYNIQPFCFLGLDTRVWDSPFTSECNNKVWEMFKWLILHKDEYSLSTHYKFNEKKEVVKKVLGFNKNAEVLDYYKLIKQMANEMCYINYDIEQYEEL